MDLYKISNNFLDLPIIVEFSHEYMSVIPSNSKIWFSFANSTSGHPDVVPSDYFGTNGRLISKNTPKFNNNSLVSNFNDVSEGTIKAIFDMRFTTSSGPNQGIEATLKLVLSWMKY